MQRLGTCLSPALWSTPYTFSYVSYFSSVQPRQVALILAFFFHRTMMRLIGRTGISRLHGPLARSRLLPPITVFRCVYFLSLVHFATRDQMAKRMYVSLILQLKSILSRVFWQLQFSSCFASSFSSSSVRLKLVVIDYTTGFKL